MVLALVRGDHRLNEIKLRNTLAARFRQATAEEIEAELGPPGYIGPVGARGAGAQGRGDRGRRLLRRRQPARRAPDRGRAGPRLRLRGGRHPPRRGRRYLAPAATRSRSRPRSRSATSSSSGPATPSRSARPTSTPTARSGRSSWAATASGRRGSSPRRSSSAPTRRGSSGRARSRPGRSTWSRSARPASETIEAADRLYEELEAAGLETLYDDRDAGAGEKLTDAELLGCPLRIVVGKRALAEGQVEAQERAQPAPITASTVPTRPRRAARDPRLALGLRSARARVAGGRSGFQAPAVRHRPLRARPRSSTRRGAAAAPVDAPEPRRLPAAGGDPGLPACSPSTPATAARSAAGAALPRDHRSATTSTGSWPARPASTRRMGALLDPVVDRLTVLGGAVVCWHFELLPALGAGAARGPRAGRPWSSPSWRCAGSSTSRSTGSAGSASSWSSAASSGRMVFDWWIIEAGVRRRRRAQLCATLVYVREPRAAERGPRREA